MNNITKKQNEPANIDMLAAQRHIYARVKNINLALMIIDVVIPMFVSMVYWGQIQYIVTTVVVLLIVLHIVLEHYREQYQALAARIQTKFDFTVYELDWHHMFGNEPTSEEIYDNKQDQDRSGLYDWYSPCSLSELSREKGILVCMNENLTYDDKLRRCFKRLAIVTIALLVAIHIGCGLYMDITLRETMKTLLVLSPIIPWLYGIWTKTNQAIDTLQKAKEKVDDVIKLAIQDKQIEPHDLLDIQNIIQKHREINYCMPDMLYNFLRERLEMRNEYCGQKLVDQLRRSET